VTLPALVLLAQSFTQRGFIETPLLLYPQTAPNDRGRAVAELLVRWEAAYKPAPNWKFNFGADAQTDTHRQTARDGSFSFLDRTRLRPTVALRRASVAYTRDKWSFEAGKQIIRWGRTDALTPTDRWAPRDYSNFARNDFLPVAAARLTWTSGSDSLDAIYAPRFSPSRTPLLNQRWSGLITPVFNAVEGTDAFPGGGQYGARWSHIGRRHEHAIAFFEGFNHLPLVRPAFDFAASDLTFSRFFPQMRMIGGDLAVPLSWFTVKGEAAYFTSRTPEADHYWLYTIEAERVWGEWVVIAGYAGESVTLRNALFDFAPDRGLTRAFTGRAQYTIDARRSVSLDAAVRRNGAGSLVRGEYTQTFGAHWRVSTGFAWIRGDAFDFLGQFNRNSYGFLTMRYSF
jgi:hypothetical protein